MGIGGKKLAVVIPAYNVAGSIGSLVKRIPPYVDWIIIVNDASTDSPEETIFQISDPRVVLLNHDINVGVGGAMVTGYRKALELKADLIAKIDADGQMPPEYLDRFAKIAIIHKCDYIKANRFGHLKSLSAMPKIRLFGSLILTFLTKFASGYWNVFDPQNGYVMITRNTLKRLDLARIDKGYFFENSMLINLNIIRARIGELYLPAHYGQEKSHMKISKIIGTFPVKLFKGFLYRVYQKYIFRSLSPFAIYLLFGILSISWGCIWGGIAWCKSFVTQIPATTGTVTLALLPLLLGWVAILHAIALDVQDPGPCILFDYDDESLI